MAKPQQTILTILRLSLAWIFLYSSISKIMAGAWSAEGLLLNATSFPELFAWFAQSSNLGWVNFMNIYGQLALGLALLVGIFLPIAAIGGILMMALYYVAQLHFPYAGRGTTSFLIDQHVIYTLCLVLLWKFDAGRSFGLKQQVERILPKQLKRFN